MGKGFSVIILLYLLFSCFGNKTYAQSIDYSVQANIIYHFTKYIDWPDDRKIGNFIIGVVGDSPILDELKKATVNKTVGSQKIVIKHFQPSDTPFTCHILFIGGDESDLLKMIASLTYKTSVLIVTEEEGLAQKGSCINFIVENDRTKLEFNLHNIDKRKLKIASELITLGSSKK